MPLVKTADSIRSSYPFRLATHPFWITPQEMEFFNQLGDRLLAFYRAAHQLYLGAIGGTAPSWVSEYLDQGKPPEVRMYGRMKQNPIPGIIRPDLILTHPEEGMEGMMATELDSVPGGIGLTLELAQRYKETIISGHYGMRDGFDQMIRQATTQRDPVLAIVISEESASYRPEMERLGTALNEAGLTTFVVPPEAISCSENGVFLKEENKRLTVIYRFFELFDLENIPQSNPILNAAQNQQVTLTPPPAAHLEEKMLFALFHHPDLKSFWINRMGHETTSFLTKLFPQTWILDPRNSMQLSSALQNLIVNGGPISSFYDLGPLGQKARRFVIKPSGFSPLAWGSRGVRVGHDLPEEKWNNDLKMALEGFYTTPWVLQPFYKGRRVQMEYIDPKTDSPIQMEGRVRLSPYYFVIGRDEVFLGGILATVCPLDKKLIHGMSEAIMAPCAIGKRDDEII